MFNGQYGSGGGGQDAQHRVFLSWLVFLKILAVVLFISAQYIILADKPFVFTPPDFDKETVRESGEFMLPFFTAHANRALFSFTAAIEATEDSPVWDIAVDRTAHRAMVASGLSSGDVVAASVLFPPLDAPENMVSSAGETSATITSATIMSTDTSEVTTPSPSTTRRLLQTGASGDTFFVPLVPQDPVFNESYVETGVRNAMCEGFDGVECRSSEFFSRDAEFKTLSLGILQHPGFAAVGYALPMGIMLVGSTILGLALGSSMIILSALGLHFGFSAMLGYHEFGGQLHDTAAVVTAICGTTLHIFTLSKLWNQLEYLKWVYVALIALMFVGFLFLILFQLLSFGTALAYSIVEHGIVSITVLAFVFPIYALQQISGKMMIYVEGISDAGWGAYTTPQDVGV